MHIKNTMRYHFTLVRIAILMKRKISVGEDVKKLEPLYTVGGNSEATVEKNQYGGTSKN